MFTGNADNLLTVLQVHRAHASLGVGTAWSALPAPNTGLMLTLREQRLTAHSKKSLSQVDTRERPQLGLVPRLQLESVVCGGR